MSRVGAFLLGLILINAVSGCYQVSHDFILEQKTPTDPVIIHKPDVGRGKNGIQIKIPWLELKGCPSEIPPFSRSVNPKVNWTLSHSFWTGTTAELNADVILSVAQDPGILATIYNSIKLPDSCVLELTSDAPKLPTSDQATDQTNRRTLLAMYVAERLPRSIHMTWVDQYDYDEKSQSLNILPGMRLRVEHSIPLITDEGKDEKFVQPGVVAAPSYLQLFKRSANDLSTGSWSVLLRRIARLEPNARDKDPNSWVSVSGIGDLLGQDRYWRIFYPKGLAGARINEQFLPIEGIPPASVEYAPAVALVSAVKRSSLLNFISNQGKEDFASKCETLSSDDKIEATPGTGKCFIFRYKAFAIPEILIEFNGQPEWVELGTKVCDLLHRKRPQTLIEQLDQPSVNWKLPGAINNNLNVARALSAWETLQGRGLPIVRREQKGKFFTVKLAENTPVPSTVLLNLVLEMGDQVIWPH